MSTPSGAGAGKVCVMCGEDVSAKPRTKDAKGRYYCQSCYQKATQQKQARREAMPLPKVPPVSPTPPPRVHQDEPVNMLEQLLAVEQPARPMQMICPSCKSSIPAGGMLCVNCGYNLQTGAAVGHTTVRVAKPSGTLWPGIIGGLSMLFGGAGAIIYAFNLVRVLNSGAEGSRLIGGLGGAGLTIGLSLWLLVAGLNIARKQSTGVSQIRRWAIVKLALCIVCFGPAILLAAAAFSKSERDMPEELRNLGSALTTYLLLILGWIMFWPIFTLAWFSRVAVKNDVERWD